METLVPTRGQAILWVVRHPVAAFLLWAFTVGQAVAFVPVLASSRGVELPVQPFTTASTLIRLLLPTLALTWLIDGRPTARTLLSRLAAVRRPMGWYALWLAVVPVVSVA